jgi:cellulose synthase (UDP-forming)
MQGAYRQTFWGEVYETVLAWYIARPTTVALFSPSRGKFNVTAKGGLMEENQFDWQTAKPYLVLSMLNVLGLGFAVWRLFTGPADEIITVIVSVLWVIYNLLIIGAAVAVAAEVRQVRQTHRVQTRLPGAIKLADGHRYPCELVDYSDGGVGLLLNQPLPLATGSLVSLILQRGNREFVFTGTLTRSKDLFMGLNFADLPPEQKIEFVQCTFGRADAWLDYNSGFEADKPVQSLKEILALGAKGYYRLYEYLPAWLRHLARPFVRVLQWLGSFLPRMPKASTPLISRPVSKS